MTSYYFAILKNEDKQSHIEWAEACENMHPQVTYKVIDITGSLWLETIINEDFDCLLTRPPGQVSFFKNLYDERVFLLNKVIGKRIYPTYEEILVYENKKALSYWLKAMEIPHPKTAVFYHRHEALDFSEYCSLPVVAKTSIGASGTGVRIFNYRKDIKRYIDRAFSGKGLYRNWGPNLNKGDIAKRTISRLKNIPGLIGYLRNKRRAAIMDPQKGYVIFQEYIKCDFEWRCVRIGDSFFAHKKLPGKGDKKSGTSKVSWQGPSDELLNFVKEVTGKSGFLSQAVDIFEPEPGSYLVNEMQCFWGSKNPHQMIVNGKPGRYIFKKNNWTFEEGDFNKNNSYNLRLAHVIELMENKKNENYRQLKHNSTNVYNRKRSK